MIGDPRNDENTIVSQLQVAFLRAHNALVAEGRTFDEARTILRQHYQHLVVHDFLPRVADPAVVADILQSGPKVFDPGPAYFFMPLEFSVAAYRFGHSMVRSAYDFNLNFNLHGGIPATLGLLFTFSAFAGQLGNFDTLPENWIVEWGTWWMPGNRSTGPGASTPSSSSPCSTSATCREPPSPVTAPDWRSATSCAATC